MAEDASGIDYSALGGLSQEDVNKRILAAMMMQGSAKYDQAMLADTLGRSKVAPLQRARGKGWVGEANDFMSTFTPAMERSASQEMVRQLREKDMATMRQILGTGQAAQGQNRAPMLTDAAAAGPAGPAGPPVDPGPGMLQQPRSAAQPGMPGAPAIGMRPMPQKKPNPLAPGLDVPELDPTLFGS